MKKIKNGIMAAVAATAGVASLGGVTSCSKPMYSTVKHIAPYLHEITYDDYRYDEDEETTKGAEAFGCSSVRNGDFYGRNFDYIFNDTPEFVVRVKAKKNRHASIGIATHFGLREKKLLKGEYKKQLELVPNLTLDGINDAGVICSHNVVSMEAKTAGVTPETNPNAAKKIHQLFVPRYILDNAGSVDEAIKLLQDPGLNIQGNLNGDHFLHVMIADKDKTAIVEFFAQPGHNHFDVVVDYKTGNQQIMTNYYCNNHPTFTNKEKNGDERYEILKAGYETSNSFAGMEALMKQVMFSRAYRYSHNRVPMRVDWTDPQDEKIKYKGDLNSEWYSEFVDYSKIYEEDPETGKPLFDWNSYLVELTLFKQDYWNARLLDVRNPAEPNFWQTTHNSTYDMKEKHLRVVVQEEYETYFDYYL